MPHRFTIASQAGFIVSQMNRYSLPKLIMRKDYLRKDGTAAINLQIIINRKKKIIATDVLLYPQQWDAVAEKVMLPKQQLNEQNSINIRLQQFKSRALEILQKYELFKLPLDIILFEREFQQADRFRDLITYIHEILPTLPAKPGTKKTYRTMLMHLSNFRSEVPFNMLSVEFLREWEHYLVQQKLAINTINKHHKILQKFIINAINEDIPVINPYTRYTKRPNKKVTRQYLTAEEVNRLIELYNSANCGERVLESLSAFLFSCIGGGYRISEIKILTEHHVKNDEVFFEAPKTNRTKGFRSIKLTDGARSIIEHRRGKLFDFNHENKVNMDLKQIAIMAKIPKTLSFHIARHTFAMQYLINGGKVENLMHILGHSKIETTMQYVHMHDELVNQKMHIMNKYAPIRIGGTS